MHQSQPKNIVFLFLFQKIIVFNVSPISSFDLLTRHVLASFKYRLVIRDRYDEYAQLPNELLCFFFFFLPCENVTCVLFLPACVGSPTTPENENDPTRKYSNKLVNKKKQDTISHETHPHLLHTFHTVHTRARAHTSLSLFIFKKKKKIIIINPRKVI